MARMNYHGMKNNALEQLENGGKLMSELMAFKAAERKDDPARRMGLHGPYEELSLLKTGKLPPDYYQQGDEQPWGLRLLESRSNILWQVLSGVLDKQPEFAAAYLSLALDNTLGEDDYAKELGKLHTDFRKFLEHAGVNQDHQHGMKSIYRSVACPACSIATAMACRDADMHALFTQMIPMKAQDRRRFLGERGLMPLMNTMIPEPLKLAV